MSGEREQAEFTKIVKTLHSAFPDASYSFCKEAMCTYEYGNQYPIVIDAWRQFMKELGHEW